MRDATHASAMMTRIISLLISIFFLHSCETGQVNYTAPVKEFNGNPVLFINVSFTYPMIYSLTGVPGARMPYGDCAPWNIRRSGEAGTRL